MEAQSEVILPTRPREEAALNVERLSTDIFNSLQVNNLILCEPLLKISLETKVESFEGGQLAHYCCEWHKIPSDTEVLNRPYSYSQYWTGTSLQWRLMRGNILKTICI